jgi:hypothetical protein
MNPPLQHIQVDLVVLSRDEAPLNPDVEQGIASQRDVRLIVHRVIGTRLKEDRDRLTAIVRARNEGKRCGTSRWLMFLDDDVVLAPDCVSRLLEGLRAHPAYAALGADYLNESQRRMASSHVAMGAVLFRRTALDQVKFRRTDDWCECACMCNDLRRRKLGIGYLPAARARHISLANGATHSALPSDGERACENPSLEHSHSHGAYVLTAFDRRHLRKFKHRFLASLRGFGNEEPVLAFGYDLYPSEQRALARLKGVELIAQSSNGVEAAILRLQDFQGAVGKLPPETPVAYWDAGDVIFQDRLSELWSVVRANPARLLVVAEPFGHPENKAVSEWTLSIADPDARKYAFDLLSSRPYFNGGFAAATAGTMLRYLRAAHELRHSKALHGTSDWGDQTAMNLYCHGDPARHLAVDNRWNYCLWARRHEVQLLAEGRFVRRDGRPLSVVHGNARTLTPYAILAPAALARSSHTSVFVI